MQNYNIFTGKFGTYIRVFLNTHFELFLYASRASTRR